MRGLLLVFSLGGPPRGAGDAWFAEDKLKHFFTSAFVQSLGYGSLRAAGVSHGAALAGATAATLAAGVGKELYDRNGRGTPSGRDLVWDAAGAAAASALLAKVAR